MKIAVAAMADTLDADVSEQFGRAPYFVIVESDTLAFEAFANPAVNASGGAGPMAAQEIANRQAEIALAGRLGPKAQTALEAAGIRFNEASGKVRDAVQRLNA